jgi:hypothetical protein
VAVFVGGGWIVHKLVFAVLRQVVKNRDVFWRGVVERGRAKLRVMMIIVALGSG